MEITNLALALGSSLTAGLNLYMTVLALGLMHRFEFLTLPDNLEILANPWILVTAGVLLVVEFFADKFPYVDNLWDTAHSFIRIPAGAILAAAAVGDVPDSLVWAAALAGGFVSLTSHGAKASTRLAVNATPEPFTNWFLSFVEDGVTLLVLWLVSAYPYAALALSALLLLLFATLIYLFYRFFKLIFRTRRAGWSQPTAAPPR